VSFSDNFADIFWVFDHVCSCVTKWRHFSAILGMVLLYTFCNIGWYVFSWLFFSRCVDTVLCHCICLGFVISFGFKSSFILLSLCIVFFISLISRSVQTYWVVSFYSFASISGLFIIIFIIVVNFISRTAFSQSHRFIFHKKLIILQYWSHRNSLIKPYSLLVMMFTERFNCNVFNFLRDFSDLFDKIRIMIIIGRIDDLLMNFENWWGMTLILILRKNIAFHFLNLLKLFD